MGFLECLTIDYFIRNNRVLSFQEICCRLLLNPGYRAVIYYRYACYLRKVRIFRRCNKLLSALIIARLSRVPGVEFGSIAEIGNGLLLYHPHDIVIGRGAVIGENVTVYNGVTLGARRRIENNSEKNISTRYPTIEDGVIIYSGVKILGPITIGRNSIIGANAVVLYSCPPGSVLVGVPANNINSNHSEYTYDN